MMDSKNFCVVEKCDNYAAKKVCKKHQVEVRLGRLEAGPGWGVKRNPDCSREGCDWAADSRKDGSLCHTHRLGATGSRPKLRNGEKAEFCSVDGCQAPPLSRNLCGLHYERNRRGVSVVEASPCAHEGCPLRTRKGYCGKHIYQFKKYGVTWDNSAPDSVREARRAAKPVCAVGSCSVRVASAKNLLCPRHNAVRSKLRVDSERYLELMAVPACEMCGDEVPLVTDHDHSCHSGGGMCGRCIRGRICSPCNSALGFLRDDPDRARAAISYLERFELQG